MPPKNVRPPGSRRKCQYKGCKNVKKDCIGKRFFCFPNPDKKPELFKQWVINTENIQILDSLAKNLLHKTVCADHFKPSSFRDARRIKLWPNAVPEPRECTISDTSPRVAHHQTSTPDKVRPSNDSQSPVNASPIRNKWNPKSIMDSPSGNRWNPSLSLQQRRTVIDSPKGNQWNIDKPGTIASTCSLSTLFNNKTHTSPDSNVRLEATRILSLQQSSVNMVTNVYSKSVQVGKSTLKKSNTRLDSSAKRSMLFRLKNKKSPPAVSNQFLNMIHRHNKKCKFSQSERNMILSLYYKSPSAYHFLREHLDLKGLPTKQTIIHWLKNITVRPGWSSDFFKLLSNKVKDMPNTEKDVVMIMDEINLKKGLEYDLKSDSVIGFHNHGGGSSQKLANHALLMMIRGLKARWKLPVAHFFSCGVTTSVALADIVKHTVRHLLQVGLRVRAIVCDQGSTNRKAMNILGVTKDKPHFQLDNNKIYLVYDVPHLIKNIRNNMMKADGIIFESGTAKWIHIKNLFHYDQRKEDNIVKARLNTRLTDKHINPVGREKMNVRLATQVFSHTVQAALFTASQMPEFGIAAEETAVFVGKVNDCFDALNSKALYGRSNLHSALSVENNVPEDFLRNMVTWCEKLKIISENDKMKTVPCFWGLKMSLLSVLGLWEDMKKENTHYLLTSRLNQDPIENEFSMIRQRGGWNLEPTPAQFSRYTL